MKHRINKTADASEIERLCVDKGLCMTEQRRIVARVLSTTHDHPDIEELHQRVRTIDSRIALSTIYRTVRLLCRNGIIEKHNFGIGRARLEPAPEASWSFDRYSLGESHRVPIRQNRTPISKNRKPAWLSDRAAQARTLRCSDR
jgi:Fe2+ or Zn2+ uptake regulation protein